MDSAFAVRGADDCPGALVDHQLRLQGVMPFLAGKHALLVFFGRSTGLSVTSTTTTSRTQSDCTNAFFPGSLNRPERIKVCSTCRMIRNAVDSLDLLREWQIRGFKLLETRAKNRFTQEVY